MAEKSPRPGAEEDAEEGEEAAEAPVRAVKAVTEKNLKADDDDDDDEEEGATPDSPPPPPPGEEEEALLHASSPSPPSQVPESAPAAPLKPGYTSSPPSVPAVPTCPQVTPVYPPVSPTIYDTSPVLAAYNSKAAAYTCPAVSASSSGMNLFANDGSFMELFKKKMEASTTENKEETKVPEETKPEPDKRKPVSFVGKRRGGAKLALKTGIVAKKPKTEEEEILTHKGGAWAQYMAEVKKYKAHQCSDDDKTRPLVK
ncbi:telomerase RNA component interacting RNase [Rhinoderma darwinii]|uniref:telomerase RNA component interacting RNase n=1 Tax=Rhinoderma darwinii TaxID=43563 RepID=UPI003F6696B0